MAARGFLAGAGVEGAVARRVAVTAGLSTNVPAYTVNRLRGSGLQATWSAAMEKRGNGLDLTLAGGVEWMAGCRSTT